jgi:hypothetical protein
MQKIKRLWMPVLLGGLLMGTVVGVAGARPDARPLEQGWMVITIPPDHCYPDADGCNFDQEWGYVETDSGSCTFRCPVTFPAAGEQALGAVNVKRFTMYAYDSDGGAQACGELGSKYPPSIGAVSMSVGCTVDSAADPQTVMDTTIDGNPVYRVQGPFLDFWIGAPGIRVYGFFIHYTWQ